MNHRDVLEVAGGRLAPCRAEARCGNDGQPSVLRPDVFVHASCAFLEKRIAKRGGAKEAMQGIRSGCLIDAEVRGVASKIAKDVAAGTPADFQDRGVERDERLEAAPTGNGCKLDVGGDSRRERAHHPSDHPLSVIIREPSCPSLAEKRFDTSSTENFAASFCLDHVEEFTMHVDRWVCSARKSVVKPESSREIYAATMSC